MRALRLAAASVLLVLVSAAIAYAGTVTQDPSTISYTASPSTASGEAVTVGMEGQSAFVTADKGVTAGGNCVQTDANRVDCPTPPAVFKVTLLAYDDVVVADLVTGATTLEAHAGGGGDSLSGTLNADSLFGDEGD